MTSRLLLFSIYLAVTDPPLARGRFNLFPATPSLRSFLLQATPPRPPKWQINYN